MTHDNPSDQGPLALMDLEPDPREGACRSRQGIMGSGVYSMSNKWGHAQSTHEASRVDGGS